MAGEERTPAGLRRLRQYLQFQHAIEDDATVPLYYENRIPELQLTNAEFADELDALLEEAELDEDAEGALARKFGTQYTC